MSTTTLPAGGIKEQLQPSNSDPGIAVAGVALSVVMLFGWLHPHPLVLPLLSVILVIASIVMATVTVLINRGGAKPLMERLHLAGLVIFFGFAAAMMGDPDPAVRSLDAIFTVK